MFPEVSQEGGSRRSNEGSLHHETRPSAEGVKLYSGFRLKFVPHVAILSEDNTLRDRFNKHSYCGLMSCHSLK